MGEVDSLKSKRKGFSELIKSIGLRDGLDGHLVKRIKLTNQLTAYIIGIASIYIFVFYLLGIPLLGNLTILASLSFLLVFLLNRLGQYLLARICFILNINLLVYFYCRSLGKDVDMHTIYFALACTPWLLFDMKEWVWTFLSVSLSVVLFFYFVLFESEPLVVIMPQYQSMMALSFYIVVFVVAGLSVGLMSRANDVQERKLETSTATSLELIKELKEVNSQLEEQQLLKQLNSELEKVIAEKQQVNSQLERFSYMIAHDLKSPIHGATGLLELIKLELGGETKGQTQEYMDLLRTALKHLSTMIDSVLDYSRTNLNQNSVEEVDVQLLLQEIEDLLFLPRNTEFRIQPGMPRFFTNKFKLLQVFQNFISNAIKYNDKEFVLVEVGVEEREDFYYFTIKDNGPGIKAEDHRRLFHLFETGDQTHADQTGIGLNIIKVLVEEQGGKLYVDSELGLGSSFGFEWAKYSNPKT